MSTAPATLGQAPFAALPVRTENATMAIVGIAHGTSHFFHLTLAPLFPWLKDAFSLSYSELGLLVTVFFIISGVGQALSGFLVDRIGAWPVMMGALGSFVLAACVLAAAPGYSGLMLGAVLCGVGNAPFHPVDYSILNARISPARLGKAYAIHGVSGSLGWAAAPVLLATVAQFAGWRIAFLAAGLVALTIMGAVWKYRALMQGVGGAGSMAHAAASAPGASTFGFLRLPAVWLSFWFFFAWAAALGGVLTFGPEAARVLHEVPLSWVATCVTVYMLGSAGGMLVGGYLVADPSRADRVVAVSLSVATVFALLIGWTDWPAWTVPPLFALMGLGMGLAGPSRDLLVKRATPPGATGRVYGMVYSGLDIGMSVSPTLFGMMMDAKHPAWVWVGIALFQAALIGSALNIGRITGRRPVLAA